MQDPNPLPWGAQDRFQAHFIVRKEISDYQLLDFTAKTKLQTNRVRHHFFRLTNLQTQLYRITNSPNHLACFQVIPTT